MSETPAGGRPKFATVDLDQPIERGEQAIAKLTLKKPMGGELRGLNLVNLTQLDVNSLHKLLPRICTPAISEQDVQGMDPADLLACAAEVAGFFLTTQQMADSPPT